MSLELQTVHSKRIEKAATVTLTLAVGLVGFVLLRRTYRRAIQQSVGLGLPPALGLSRSLTPFSSENAAPQRTVTILASLEEIELFFMDAPRLAGFELGRDLEIQFTFHPGPAAGTEIQARLLKWPSRVSRIGADRLLRDFLREAKQLIETGEVARIDDRIHGPRSQSERRDLRRTERLSGAGK